MKVHASPERGKVHVSCDPDARLILLFDAHAEDLATVPDDEPSDDADAAETAREESGVRP